MQYVLGNMLNGGGINPDGLSLDLQFAADKTFSKPSSLAAGETAITSRRGPSATFLRSTAATEVGPDGLIRYAPENILLRSQEFNLSPWGTNNAMTVTPDATIAPDGTLTADAINFDTNISSRIIYVAGSAVVHTFSVWLRADTNKTCIIATGAVGSAQLGGVVNVTTTWQRFSVVASNWPSGTASFSVRIANNATGTSGTIFAWGAQLERHTSARAYIPTTTAAVYGPRFDHDPVTLACKGLLIEEGRTNSLLRSAEMTVSPWSGVGSSRNTTTQTAPDGGTSAISLIENTSSGDHIIFQNIALSSAAYAFSVFAKANTRNWIFVDIFNSAATPNSLGAYFNLSSGTIGNIDSGVTASIIDFGNGWYRCSVSATRAVSSAVVRLASANGTNSYIGNGTSGVFLWGAQLEAGSFPTSYIPTTTGSVVRSADVCNITGGDFNNFYNQSEGTLLLGADEFRIGINYPTLLGISNSASAIANRISIVSYGSKTENAIPFEFVITSGGTVQYSAFSTSTPSNFKAALAYKLDDARAALNGALAAADAPPSVMPIGANNLRIGGVGIYISSIRYYKKRLPNAKLAQLTV
jgi:hypothetical protein